jgi:hypothetical protein
MQKNGRKLDFFILETVSAYFCLETALNYLLETRFFHIFWHIFRFFGIFFDFLAFFKNMQILGKSGKIAFFGIARNIGFVGSG